MYIDISVYAILEEISIDDLAKLLNGLSKHDLNQLVKQLDGLELSADSILYDMYRELDTNGIQAFIATFIKYLNILNPNYAEITKSNVRKLNHE